MNKLFKFNRLKICPFVPALFSINIIDYLNHYNLLQEFAYPIKSYSSSGEITLSSFLHCDSDSDSYKNKINENYSKLESNKDYKEDQYKYNSIW